MSWWGGKTPVELIEAATSETIPSGEQNVALNLDISDIVRSKKMPADVALKTVRKRLYNVNPNVQILALHLLDLLIKNGGSHFLDEVASKDFMDAYVAQIRNLRNQNKNPEVVDLMLEYIQLWAAMTKTNTAYGTINSVYEQLRNTPGIVFPETAPLAVSSSFLQTETAPIWVDSETCMKSGQPFSFYNRKHHCRNCGGVFILEHCNDFMPLPHYGITEPVRVCVDCKEKLDSKYNRKGPDGGHPDAKSRHHLQSNNADLSNGRYDRDLRKAMELSLRDSSGTQLPARPIASARTEPVEEMDEDLKAAIAASLADMEATKSQAQAAQAQGNGAFGQAQAQHTPVSDGLIKPEDFEQVGQFLQALRTAQPQDAIYDPNLVGLNKSALGLQPRLVRELTSTADKLEILEDLHGRMMALSGYYDRLLDAELRPKNIQSQHAPQPAQMAPQHAQLTGQTTGQSNAQPQYNGQYGQPMQPQGTGQYSPFSQGVQHQNTGPHAYSGTPSTVQLPQGAQAPSYAPSYSHVTVSAPPAPSAPSAPSAPAVSAPTASAPSFPQAPTHIPSAPEQLEEPEPEPEPEQPAPVLIEL